MATAQTLLYIERSQHGMASVALALPALGLLASGMCGVPVAVPVLEDGSRALQRAVPETETSLRQ